MKLGTFEIQQLKDIFCKNEYRKNFVNSCFKNVAENGYAVKQKTPTEENKPNSGTSLFEL